MKKHKCTVPTPASLRDAFKPTPISLKRCSIANSCVIGALYDFNPALS